MAESIHPARWALAGSIRQKSRAHRPCRRPASVGRNCFAGCSKGRAMSRPLRAARLYQSADRKPLRGRKSLKSTT